MQVDGARLFGSIEPPLSRLSLHYKEEVVSALWIVKNNTESGKSLRGGCTPEQLLLF